MLGNARGGVKLNIFGGARSAPQFFIPFWVEKLGLGGGITPPREPRGGITPFTPLLPTLLSSRLLAHKRRVFNPFTT